MPDVSRRWKHALGAGGSALAIVFCVRTLAWAPAWLAGWLPFNTDGWFTVFLGNWYASILNGSTAMPMFPVGHPAAFGDPQPIPALFFWILQTCAGRGSAIWIFWIAGPAFFAGGWAAAAYLFGLHRAAAVLSAVFVSCNNYFWAVGDDLIWVLPWWLPFGLIALLSLRRHRMMLAGVVLGLQACSGVYPFILQCGFLASLGLLRILAKQRTDRVPEFRLLAGCLAISLVVAAPMFGVLSSLRESFDPVDPLKARTVLLTTGLQPDDFLRHLDSNLLYPEMPFVQPPPNPWVAQRRVAGVGLLLPLLALVGIYLLGRRVGVAALVIIVGWILVAVGPVLYLPDGRVRMPLLWIYDHVAFADYFRVPSRAWFVVIMGMGLLAGYAWHRIGLLRQPAAYRLIAGVFVGLLFLIENTPVPAPAWDNRALTVPPVSQVQHHGPVAFVPSDLGWDVRHADRPIHPYSREIGYMLFAADLGLAVPNGVNSYVPHERIQWRNRLRRWQIRPEQWVGAPEAIPLIVVPSLALPEEAPFLERLLAVLAGHCDRRERVWVCVPGVSR